MPGYLSYVAVLVIRQRQRRSSFVAVSVFTIWMMYFSHLSGWRGGLFWSKILEIVTGTGLDISAIFFYSHVLCSIFCLDFLLHFGHQL